MSVQTHSEAKLFQPARVGNLNLAHRIVYAPVTRFRNDDAHVPLTDLVVEYYAQRASVPGTLLIAEATAIAPKAGGIANIPGIWSNAQVAAWKKVVDAVHTLGSCIYLQIWALGRAAEPDFLSQPDCPQNPGGPYSLVSSSDIPLSDRVKKDGERVVNPRPLTHEEILEYIDLFGAAAHNAVHRAGFDGVEIHAAHGYLIDQFTKDTANKRSDIWGGDIENRTRFALEVLKKVTSIVGEERTAIRLSPFADHRDMGMKHPQPTFAYLVSRIREAWPHLSYLHLVEPRVAGVNDRKVGSGESLDFLRAIWNKPTASKTESGSDTEKNENQSGSVLLVAGGYKAEDALRACEETGDLIAFGRFYTSNPDLPARIKKGLAFTPYDRSKFYAVGRADGYIDYPFADVETEERYKSRSKRSE